MKLAVNGRIEPMQLRTLVGLAVVLVGARRLEGAGHGLALRTRSRAVPTTRRYQTQDLPQRALKNMPMQTMRRFGRRKSSCCMIMRCLHGLVCAAVQRGPAVH